MILSEFDWFSFFSSFGRISTHRNAYPCESDEGIQDIIPFATVISTFAHLPDKNTRPMLLHQFMGHTSHTQPVPHTTSANASSTSAKCFNQSFRKWDRFDVWQNVRHINHESVKIYSISNSKCDNDTRGTLTIPFNVTQSEHYCGWAKRK